MAESVGKLVLTVLQNTCCIASCPYKEEGNIYREQLESRISEKLKHRVSGGKEVRVLEKRVKALELAVARAIEWSDRGRKLNQHDIAYLHGVLDKKD